ncbi:MAG TPA: glutathione synthase, partial [Burkholderiales bacterium]
MELLFVVDPLEDLKAYKDSSVAMMREAASRGHAVWACLPGDMAWTAGGVAAETQHLAVSDDDHEWHQVEEQAHRHLAGFGAVLMRKDPPFDLEYLYSTHLLELAEGEGARVVNSPRALRDYNEKLAIAKFSE